MFGRTKYTTTLPDKQPSSELHDYILSFLYNAECYTAQQLRERKHDMKHTLEIMRLTCYLLHHETDAKLVSDAQNKLAFIIRNRGLE